ncbi:MAG: hypothetical protein RIT04_585, partial [Candidatus Parcubacteria bacterium]
MLKELKEKLLHQKKTADQAETQATADAKAESKTEKKAKKPKKPVSSEITEAIEAKKNSPMGKLLDATTNPAAVGDIVEGPVINIEKSAVYIDLAPMGTGIIYGREFITARDIIKKINIGDVIAAKVVDTENKDGYLELSLKEARQALIWSEAEEAISKKLTLELPVLEANKGGLIIQWQGISGFLPASQLKPEHYPRVADGDKDKILEELRKLVGKKISVSIISAIPKEGKLIFSEKNPETKDKKEIIGKYKVGDTFDGIVTGIVDFGVFVKIEEGLEGLFH